MRRQTKLQLSNGDCFIGQQIGAPLNASGELVFTTAMVGYSESLTDPSYFGQILVFAYPLIGNYGIPKKPDSLSDLLPKGFESEKIHTSAVIVASDSQESFHWSSMQSLDQWLRDAQVPGIVGLDTRHLVQLIRNNPQLKARLMPQDATGNRIVGSIDCYREDDFFDAGQIQIVPEVSCKERTLLGKGRTRIAALDCGIKWNIIRQLIDLDCEVELLPWDSKLTDVDCHGWLLSNGPGNPYNTGVMVDHVKELFTQERPILGICLGHQILSLAAGAETERMAYGHRSHNQPVALSNSDNGYITSQNHGYVVKKESLPSDWDIWFYNVNDHSIEGIRHKEMPFRSVQFHPESAGGPRDTSWILRQFVSEVKRSAAQ